MEICGGGSGGVTNCCYAAKPLSPIELTAEELKKINESGDYWDTVEQIIAERNIPFDEKEFIAKARDLYERLMKAFCRICEIYNQIMGKQTEVKL